MSELERKVLDLYKQGLYDSEIAKIVNKSRDTISYYRKKHNLKSNREIFYNSIYEDLLNDLKSNKTIYSISKKYNVSYNFITNIARKNNITMKDFDETVKDRRFVNNNIFSDLDDKNTQYWLGFIAADGGVFENKISIGLKIEDEKHIDKFIKFTGYNLNKRYIKKKMNNKIFTSVVISFRNKEIKEFLESIGIVRNKSLNLDYKLNITNDFLRGVVDGDGYIRKNHSELTIATGSYIFANKLHDFIINTYKVRSTIRKVGNTYIVGVYGKNQVEKVLYKLYNNANTYLERKYYNAMLYRNI